MRNYPNIETVSWSKTSAGLPVYVGYGGGAVWHVSRISPKGDWNVRPAGRGVRYPATMRRTLGEISTYLAAFDR